MKFQTKAIHTQGRKEDHYQSIRFPVYNSAAGDFECAEDMEAAFTGKKPFFTYSRVGNPTVETFERKMTALENGLGAIAVSSGMAAISNLILGLLKAGENIVSSRSLFGNTYSLFSKTLKPYGVDCKFAKITDLAEVEAAIDENTRVLFFETIANHPLMEVADAEALVALAKKHNLTTIVDNTVTTPYLFAPKDSGIDLAIHSTTKFISGGGTSIGGIIIDLGNRDWTEVKNLSRYHKLGEMALIARLRKEIFRDMGACMAPQTAFLQSLGLETLTLRVDKASQNALAVSDFLESHPSITRVLYPGLPSHPQYELAKKQFGEHSGGIISFELSSKEACFKLLNQLKLIKRATNLNDNTSLMIHPFSTIYAEYPEEERSRIGVSENAIRFSVGIEDIEDIINDLKQALS